MKAKRSTSAATTKRVKSAAASKRARSAASVKRPKPAQKRLGDCPICHKPFRGLKNPCGHLAVAWSTPRTAWTHTGKKVARRERLVHGLDSFDTEDPFTFDTEDQFKFSKNEPFAFSTDEWLNKPDYVAAYVDLDTLNDLRQYIANLEDDCGCIGCDEDPRTLGPTRLTPLLEAHFRIGDEPDGDDAADAKPAAKAAGQSKPNRARLLKLERAYEVEETACSLHPRRLLIEAFATARGSAGHTTGVPLDRRKWTLVWARYPKAATKFVNLALDSTLETLRGLKARLARIAANPTDNSAYDFPYSDRCPVCAILKGTEEITGLSGSCEHEVIYQATDDEFGKDCNGESLAHDENYQIWKSVESLLEELDDRKALHRRLKKQLPSRVVRWIERGGDFFDYQSSLIRGLPGDVGGASLELGSGMGTGSANVRYSTRPGLAHSVLEEQLAADMKAAAKVVGQAIDAEVDFMSYLGGF